jgi:parallel beta-helix repeat protein
MSRKDNGLRRIFDPSLRSLRCERLEQRHFLSIVVDTPFDEDDGVDVGGISLRDAIAVAPAGTTIEFAASLTASGPATIRLVHGEILVQRSLTIVGPGSHLLTIDAAGSDATPTIFQGDGSRIFNITDDAFDDIAVEISGLKLTGGDVNGRGGAIASWESLTLVDIEIRGNAAMGTLGAGGGISSRRAGALKIERSIISGNMAQSNGGGIWARVYDSGRFSIAESTISGNSSSGRGGGLYVDTFNSGDVSVAASTISGNVADNSGGGAYIRTATGSETSVIQSTISGNSSQRSGGGIWSYALGFTNATISHSTITGNTADSDANNPGVETGGGVFAAGSGAFVLNHAIVAGNIDTGNQAPDLKISMAAVSSNYSLIGNGSGSGLATAPIGSPDAAGNLIGGAGAASIAPHLGPLANNGGSTLTHALTLISPAVNAGNPNAVAGALSIPEFDQRGTPFERIFSGAGQQFTRLDIGSFELSEFGSSAPLVVDSKLDGDDGNFAAGQFTLREAIRIANELAVIAPTITFASALSGETITLTGGELEVSQDMTIDASSIQGGIKVDGALASRVLKIDDGLGANVLEVTLKGVSISGGKVMGDGGGILNRENLYLHNSTITANEATGRGGGIHMDSSGMLAIVGGAVLGNHSGQAGGGVHASSSTILLEGTTISGNTSVGRGAGLETGMSTVTVVESTLSNNTSQSIGGGISLNTIFGGSLSVRRSIISGNVGGGIAAAYGSITVENSRIEGNSTSGNGGGIHVSNSGGITVRNSTIAGNHAAGAGGGVAMDGFGGSIYVFNSTVSENSADGRGGGIAGNNRTRVSFLNSTASGNSTKGWGGGIVALAQFPNNRVLIQNSTITKNVADSDNSGDGGAGGLHVVHSAVVENSIISGNSAAVGTEPDVQTSFGGGTLRFSLIGQDNGTPFSSPTYAFTTKVGSIIGTAQNPADPNLGPLQLNGGLHKTHALLVGSVAIDGGDPAAMPGVAQTPRFDGRGTTYDRVVNGRIDMGAFEFNAITADFDGDGDADGADFLTWQRNFGVQSPNGVHSGGDADLDMDVDSIDLETILRQFGDPLSVVAVVNASQSSLSVAASEGLQLEPMRTAPNPSLYATGDFTQLFSTVDSSMARKVRRIRSR